MLGVDFELLGPVEARGAGGPIPLGGLKGRSLLAALLLEANRVVSLGHLVDAAWGDDPPPTARTQVRNRVSALRRALRQAGCADNVITTTGSGYVLHVDAGTVDLGRFQSVLSEVDRSTSPARAVTLLSAALALWRGPALDGLTTPYLEVAARDLEERRLSVLERRIRLELDLGGGHELVPELTGLVSKHPYREGLHELLMLAQYRAGQQVAALMSFHTLRTTLREQFGVEPSTPLRELQTAILRGDECVLRRQRTLR
jgi:DNA-binding SARP family transcriptional activator